MTWQRIDENTYIDDTLVTCAEYQLFIDEMREQGKYYQPDHWTSYQFPAGQAREPIVGVRFRDAKVFCNWLTKQSDQDWFYRLSSPSEAKNFKINPKRQVSQGYWTSHSGKYQFSLIGKSSIYLRFGRDENIIFLERQAGPKSALELTIDNIFNDEVKHALYRANHRPLDISFHIRNAITDAKILTDDFPNEPSLLWRHRDTSPLVDNLKEIKYGMVRCSGDTCFHNSSPRAWKEILHTWGLYLVTQTFSYDVMKSPKNDVFKKNIVNLCSLLVDIHTLQQRIAGRSPAFEGIRLVKERIR